MAIHTIQDLKMRQALPLEVKVIMSKQRIRDWVEYYGEDGVYISFSGGKDSTVLLHLVRDLYPNVRAMFVDTGLEYPEIREFVKTFDNVDIVRPKMNFKQVIEKYGYPFISKEVSKAVYCGKRAIERGQKDSFYIKKLSGDLKDKKGERSRFCIPKYNFLLDCPYPISSNCCDIMKKAPAHAYEKQSGLYAKFTGQMAYESTQRATQWLKNGCNGFDLKKPTSNPLSFWTEQDILKYIKQNNIKICSVYGDIVVDYGSEDQLSGQLDLSDLGLMTDNRKYKTTGCERTGCMFCGYGCHLEEESRFERMKKTHPKQYDYIMRSKDKGGLGYKEVIDWINANSDLNIRY